jgi:TRAP-type transport system periplasmic protein
MNVQLKLAIHMEPGKPTWGAYERWVERVADKTDRAVKIDISYSGIIGIEELNSLKSGEADIARVFTMNMERFPLHTVPALPYLMPLGDENLPILNALYEQYLHDEWKDVKVLWLGLMSPYHLHTTRKPVLAPGDFRGMRVQASGLVAELVQAWGGNPVALDLPGGGRATRQDIADAMYAMLKTGAVDGVASTFEVTKDFRLYEVTKFHTCFNTIRDVNATIMNLNTWNRLPPAVQQVFEELNPWGQKELDAAQKAESAEAEDLLRQQGHQIFELSPAELSPWIEMSKPFVESSLDRLESRGFRAKTVAGALTTV